MIVKPSLIFVLLCLRESTAFTIHSQLTTTSVTSRKTPSLPTNLNHHHCNDQIQEDRAKGIGKGRVLQRRLRTFGQAVMERSDTLRSAGFYEHNKAEESKEPLIAGAKTNITLFLLALGYKWYRSIFINKMAIWERQPQWNTVITSKEDEEKAKLEALTCKSCGATIFIAKGRKWFQMPRGYECYCCGASGNDNFENTRDELLEEIEDDYFDYEKPLDFVTAAERRKLMKEAGGDEEKAIALLTQQKESEGSTDEKGTVTEEAPKKKKKKKGKKKKKQNESKEIDLAANGESDKNEATNNSVEKEEI
mmetsp:Transcript_711/g.1109  ORF Transcript_711/g.1109 Transcript_711/m.1109 type:complete len:307 (-) Transcript_711:98-1018(-)